MHISLLVLWFACTLCVSLSTTQISVLDLTDSAGDEENCLPVSTSACNLRSAWVACSTVIRQCEILLPINAILTMDMALGSLVLWDNSNVTIVGRSTAIVRDPSNIGAPLVSFSQTSVTQLTQFSCVSTAFVSFGNPSVNGGTFQFTGTGAFSFRNVTFVDSVGFYGGSIYSDGATVFCHNCTFLNSRASQGGSLFLGSASASRVENSQFLNSTASFNGGAIYLASNANNVALASNTFTDCRAVGNGGAVYLDSNNANVTIQDSVFRDGRAGSGAGLFANTLNPYLRVSGCTFQGGVASSGGGLTLSSYNHYAEIADCVFNRSVGASNDGGGAVRLSSNNYYTTLLRTKMIDNSAGYGGAISMYGNNTYLSILDCEITRATAAVYGGAVQGEVYNSHMRIEDTVFRNCSAYYNGGGLRFNEYNHYITVDRSVFDGCTAYGPGIGEGGAVYLYAYNNHFAVRNSTMSRCYANYGGGAVMLSTTNLYATLLKVEVLQSYVDVNGGAVSVLTYNHFFTMDGCTFAYCSAVYYGGAVYLDNNNNNVTVQDSTFVDNRATSGAGIYLNTLNPYLRVSGCTFQGGVASSGGGVTLSSYNHYAQIADCVFNRSVGASYDGGGAVRLTNNNYYTTILRTRMIDNSAGYGGAISMYGNNTYLSILHSDFTRATAAVYGGAVQGEVYNTHMRIEDTVFRNCSAYYNGGGVRMSEYNHYFTIVRSVFDGCSAYAPGNGEGGSIYFYGYNHYLTFRNSTIDRSFADQFGGAIRFNQLNLYVTLSKMLVSRSRANGNGGGFSVLTANHNLTIENSTFVECTAPQGGAIYLGNNNDHFLLTDSVLSRNKATLYGGGMRLFQYNDYATLYDVLFDRNFAEVFGGGLACDEHNAYLTIAGGRFLNNSVLDSGGGLYLESDHPQLTILDVAGYNNRRTLDSPHPYASGLPVNGKAYVIYNTTVHVSGASHYVLLFDPATNVGPQDNVLVCTTAACTTILFEDNSHFPGIDLPALIVDTPSFYIALVGNLNPAYLPTTLSQDYYGIEVHVSVIMRNPEHPTVFSGNVALQQGGGMYMFSSILFAVVGNTQFQYNVANKGGGGGVLMRNANTGFTFVQVMFLGNTATLDGGGILISTANYGTMFKNCTFDSNRCDPRSGFGGGVALETDNGNGVLVAGNAVTFVECTFTGGVAGKGGALSMDSGNIVVFQSGTLSDNVATVDGGAVYGNYYNILTFNDTTLTSNNARSGCGGALATTFGNRIVVAGGSITENQAYRSGAFCIYESALRFTLNVLFKQNRATTGGGAVGLYSAELWDLEAPAQVLFHENHGTHGSAVFIQSLQPSVSALQNVTFHHNTAGCCGTVYWLYDATMHSPPAGMNAPSVVWEANKAGYGNEGATQGIELVVPLVYEVTVYDQALTPPIVLYLRDWYGHFMPINASTLVYATVLTPDANFSSLVQCQGVEPYLAGLDVQYGGVATKSGYATFSQLQAYCYPNGNFSTQFIAELQDLNGIIDAEQAASYEVKNTTRFHFRPCEVGEYITNGQCEPCPDGKYSLQAGVTVCDSCSGITGVEDCYGDDLVLKDGYWRRYASNQAVQACPLIDSCIGSDATGDGLCAKGFEGPLCAVCSDGYILDDNTCVPCSTGNLFTPTVIIYVVGAGSVVVALAGFYVFYQQCINVQTDFVPDEPTPAKATEDAPAPAAPAGEAAAAADSTAMTPMQMVILWAKMKFGHIMVQLKIIVSTFQVVIAAASVLNVNMPHSYNQFSSALNVLNLNLSGLIPLSCDHKFTFIDSLVFTTLLPIGLSLALLLACLGEYTYRARFLSTATERKDMFQALKDRYLNYFFYITYLVLPSVTTKIFQTYNCTNIDPDNEDGGQDSLFLTADMTISCTSSYYAKGVVYASFMLLVYPIGIPLMYLALLYNHRHEIRSRDDEVPAQDSTATAATAGAENPLQASAKQSDASAADLEGAGQPWESPQRSMSTASAATTSAREKELHPATMRLAFLWEAYQPKYWYWEVIETTRRLMLTAVLSILAPGTSEQNVLSVFLALIYIKLYGYYTPYNAAPVNILAETGMYQIFFTFFGGLILQNNLLSDSLNALIGAWLILLNLSVIALSFYFQYQDYLVDCSAEKEREYAERRAKRKSVYSTRAYEAYIAAMRKSARKSTVARGSTAGVSKPMFTLRRASELQDQHAAGSGNEIELSAMGKGFTGSAD